ncbi:MAG: sensor histidine kinase [Spirosomataceae bacterium]
MKNLIGWWLSRILVGLTLGFGIHFVILGLTMDGAISNAGFFRYLLGWVLILVGIGGIGYLQYRWIFQPYFSKETEWIFWIFQVLIGWSTWMILEWRSDWDSEFHDENILMAGLLVILWFVMSLVLDSFRAKRMQIQWIKEKTEAELKHLKAQIKPHFFFNILNVVYGSALKSRDEETAQLIQQMGGLLRFTWFESQQTRVPVEKEVEFLHQYLDLQRARLPKRESIQLDFSIEWDGESAWISPLLLIPFLENAFQYAITYEEPCFIRGEIRLENGHCRMRCENSIAPNHSQRKGTGTGLANVRQRLELLFPSKYHVNCIEQTHSFLVTLTFPLYADSPHETSSHRSG